MTLHEAVARFELRNAPFPIRLDVVGGGRVLRVIVDVPHRDTGDPDGFVHSFPVPDWVNSPPWLMPMHMLGADTGAELIRWIADRVRAVFLHEFHECLHVDGRRMFEPHPDVAPGATSDPSTRYEFSFGPSSPPRSRF